MIVADALPIEVRHLIARAIDSPAHLELLLLLVRTEPMMWSAERASAELRLDPTFTERRLHDLVDSGLAARSSENGNMHAYFVYAPIRSVDRRDVAILQAMYGSNPETVARAIYSRRLHEPRSIGEALTARRRDSR